MHPPVKKSHDLDLTLVSAMAKHLLSPSRQFESIRLQARSATQDGMRCLATLDKVTKFSMPIQGPPVAAAQHSHPSATALQQQRQAAPAPVPEAQRFDSARPEYKASLESGSVVYALLEFHQRARGGPSRAQAPIRGFQPAPLPKVAAQPKPAARSRIFRSRFTDS